MFPKLKKNWLLFLVSKIFSGKELFSKIFNKGYKKGKKNRESEKHIFQSLTPPLSYTLYTHSLSLSVSYYFAAGAKKKALIFSLYKADQSNLQAQLLYVEFRIFNQYLNFSKSSNPDFFFCFALTILSL